MPIWAWLLIAAGAGLVSGVEAWAWLRHGTSAIALTIGGAIALAVVLGIGYALLTSDSSSEAGATDEPSADQCDPNYDGGCVPNTGGDVDCTEISDTDLTVVGDDVDGLDRDGDGIACES